jgi:flagellar biosynthesis/type III secretory pathway chaperone
MWIVMDSSRLYDILAKEAELLAEMITVEEKTTPLLLEGAAGALQSLNYCKEELIFQMKELERQRQEIFPRGLTLREYISRENPANARELGTLRSRLWKLQASLRRRQKMNRNLLQSNLRFVESVLNVLSPAGDQPLYASGGEVQEKGRDSYSAVLLDDQA